MHVLLYAVYSIGLSVFLQCPRWRQPDKKHKWFTGPRALALEHKRKTTHIYEKREGSMRSWQKARHNPEDSWLPATNHTADRCGQMQNVSFLPGGSLLRDPAFPSGLHMPVPGFVFEKVQNRLMGGICKLPPQLFTWQRHSPPAIHQAAGLPGKFVRPMP